MNTIAIINIAKGQLNIAEDDYRAMLGRITGKTSLRDMNERQKIAVMDEMKRLGFRIKASGKKLPASVKPYVRMIHALWRNCYRLGEVKDHSPAALRAFCKRFIAHGVDGVIVDPDMMSYAQASPIIEALKKMEARGRAKAKAAPNG
ncbi:regulatory protein GemA [Pseudorhodobacter sp.]|uniref:regulatory protein GemA n=1 Tax=Pseudorhodobacter sp. TaxID=1934400 RepID=UPI00264A171F|nr:regulatory protein GemA [Pseudorhodobacter sp.]MDN5785728.1 regulatory protein GemA [Pseudorhodobacter sp.]